MSSSSKTRDPAFIVILVVVAIEFLGVLLVNALATFPSNPTGWFRNSTGDISDKYYTPITPAGWAFSIWSIIYIWQACWIVYAITTVFRTNKFGKVYLNPPTISPAFLAIYGLNLGLNVTWLFVWDREYIIVATVVLALIAFSAYICAFLNHRAVVEELEQLRHHHVVDLWLNRIFVQNGIAIYATWCSIATLLNFTMSLIYLADLEMSTASYISLSFLVVDLVVYFIMDVLVFDKYLRSTFMVYPVVIWATTAALTNNWDPESYVSIYTAVIVGLACAAFVMKNIVLVFRCCRESKGCREGDSSGGIGMKEIA